MQGEVEAGNPGQHQGQVGGWGLGAVPQVPPGAAEVEQYECAEQHQGVVERQDQGAAGAAVGEADQVVQDQHHQATEQQAEQQRLALVGGGLGGRFQADGRAQLVFRHQPQVHIHRLAAAWQWQHVVAAIDRQGAGLALAPVVQLAQQLAAFEGVEVDA